MKRPTRVNIGGVVYAITYMDKPSDVDIFKRNSLWGQIDFWTRTIRVFDDGTRTPEDIMHTVMHEILHGIGQQAHLKMLEDDDNHDELDTLARMLADTLVRNGWMDTDDKHNRPRSADKS